MTFQIHPAPSTSSHYRTISPVLLAQQCWQGSKPPLFPSFSQHNCSLSPTRPWAHHKAGPLCRASGPWAPPVASKKETDTARKMCKFLWIKSVFSPFSTFIYPSGNARGARDKLPKARGAVQWGPDKDSATASKDPKCCCWMVPISPWPPNKSPSPRALCHPHVAPAGVQCTDVQRLSSREIPITATLGLGSQQHSLRLELTAAEKETFHHIPQQSRAFTTSRTNSCSFSTTFPNCCTEVNTEP